MKFSIKDFCSKCNQIRRKLRIWLHLLKKPLLENLIFCAVNFNFSIQFFCFCPLLILWRYNIYKPDTITNLSKPKNTDSEIETVATFFKTRILMA